MLTSTQANLILYFFFSRPYNYISSFSLLGYAVIPYGPGITIADLNLGFIIYASCSSLSTYGILLAG